MNIYSHSTCCTLRSDFLQSHRETNAFLFFFPLFIYYLKIGNYENLEIIMHIAKILNRNTSSDFKVLAFKFTTEVTGASKFIYVFINLFKRRTSR